MTKEKVSLALFEKSVLPALQEEHADVASLQKAIDDGYSIYRVDDGGKEISVKYRVSAKKQAQQSRDDAGNDDAGAQPNTETIEKAVSKAVDDAFAKGRSKNPGIIEVRPSFLPEGLKLYKGIKNFSGTEDEKKLKAYQWGCFILGGVMGLKKYADKLTEMGITIQKAQAENVNTAGGVLVPLQLDNYIVDLREQYGVFRRNARVTPMTRDVMEFPRRTGGLTASFAAEAAALSESTKSWDSITLTAKKLTALAKMSTELMEDAIINVGDDLAGEIAYAFSQKEDECGFTGDASATYGGIEGVNAKIKRIVGATTTSAGGVVVATGNAMSEVTLADLHGVVGALPEYADGPNCKWYCSRFFYSNVLERLARAAGGVTAAEVRGPGMRSSLGYPVEVSQVFPKTDTNSQILALFGDLSKAATFGDRRQTTISISDQAYWANDQVGIKGTERFDIVVHDVGTSTAAGPIVALQALNA